MRRCDEAGFTLIELLLAISISALLGGMAYSGLDVVITARDRSQESDRRANEVYLGMMTIARDVRHAFPREILDENGDLRQAFESEGDSYHLFSITRSGYHNPGNVQARSTLQRVRYRFDGERLLRDAWYGLDRIADEFHTTIVLSEVESLSLRFLRQTAGGDEEYTETEWIDNWVDVSTEDWQILPIAIEWKLQLRDWGTVRRIFETSPYVIPPAVYRIMDRRRQSRLRPQRPA